MPLDGEVQEARDLEHVRQFLCKRVLHMECGRGTVAKLYAAMKARCAEKRYDEDDDPAAASKQDAAMTMFDLIDELERMGIRLAPVCSIAAPDFSFCSHMPCSKRYAGPPTGTCLRHVQLRGC